MFFSKLKKKKTYNALKLNKTSQPTSRSVTLMRVTSVSSYKFTPNGIS